MTHRTLYEIFERGGRRPGEVEGSSQAGPERAIARARPLTVSQAVRAIRAHLEQGFAALLVEGEVSNLKRPVSGHWYFTLKDDASQLPAVMFARDARQVRFEVEDGQAVVARGRVTYYEGGGRTQLIVSSLEPAGLGARVLALRQLAERLAKEGLFDPGRKRALPLLPRRLGVVTSLTGAALRDVLQIARRRMPHLPVVVAATRVQGVGADAEIAAALRRLDQSGLADVIIVGRGGGAVEDLEAFSSEVVVRAVAACQTPVVSAVGHEIDTALCDLAADQRAPTPSAAAELAVPELSSLRRRLDTPVRRAAQLIGQRIARQRLQLSSLAAALADPKLMLLSRRQDLDRALQRLQRELGQRLARDRRRVERALERLGRVAPARRLAQRRARLELLALRQREAVRRALHAARARLGQRAHALDALSPLAVLGRGYAICLHQGRAVREAAALSPGDPIELRLWRGQVQADVTGVLPSPTPLDPPG